MRFEKRRKIEAKGVYVYFDSKLQIRVRMVWDTSAYVNIRQGLLNDDENRTPPDDERVFILGLRFIVTFQYWSDWYGRV